MHVSDRSQNFVVLMPPKKTSKRKSTPQKDGSDSEANPPPVKVARTEADTSSVPAKSASSPSPAAETSSAVPDELNATEAELKDSTQYYFDHSDVLALCKGIKLDPLEVPVVMAGKRWRPPTEEELREIKRTERFGVVKPMTTRVPDVLSAPSASQEAQPAVSSTVTAPARPYGFIFFLFLDAVQLLFVADVLLFIRAFNTQQLPQLSYRKSPAIRTRLSSR